MRPACLLLFGLIATACEAGPPRGAGTGPRSLNTAASPAATPTTGPVVEHWGSMREVLRDGHTQGRVVLDEVIGPHTVAVGALAGLAAEITVVGGTAHLAEVLDPDSPQGLRVRAPRAGEQATLLVLADVPVWSRHVLPAVSDLAELEASVRALAAASGIDVARPFPFRVEGVASDLRLHVLDHSCPISDPSGPRPWRFSGAGLPTVLVGFHAEGSAGGLTHHGQSSHVHALVTDRAVSGHLDEVRLAPGARLFLPAS